MCNGAVGIYIWECNETHSTTDYDKRGNEAIVSIVADALLYLCVCVPVHRAASRKSWNGIVNGVARFVARALIVIINDVVCEQLGECVWVFLLVHVQKWVHRANS